MDKKDGAKSVSRKRVYKIKLEIDIFAVINEETEKIERGLQISLKDSEIYFDKFADDDFLKQYFTDEFDFFSSRCFKELKIFLVFLKYEIGFNQVGNEIEREEFIRKYLNAFEKGLRKRLKSTRGRPKKEYSLFELLDSIDVDLFVFAVFQAISKLEDAGQKSTKTAVASELYPLNSNPVQTFNRKLKLFQITFEDILSKKPLYIDKLETYINQGKENNNKSGEI